MHIGRRTTMVYINKIFLIKFINKKPNTQFKKYSGGADAHTNIQMTYKQDK